MQLIAGGGPVVGILAGLGPWAATAAITWYVTRLVLKGKLVPRSQLEDVQADRDYWRSSHDTQQQITLKQGMTLERLLVLAETSADALQKVQSALDPRGGP